MQLGKLLFYFLGIIFFIILGGFFSSLETAFVSTNYLKVKSLKGKEPKLYRYLDRFFLRLKHFLSVTLVGTNLCIIITSTLATLILMDSNIANPSFWVTVILAPLVLLFGEMLPKSIGRVFQLRFIVYFLSLFRFLEFILKPLVYLVEFFPSKIISLFFKDKKHTLSKDDIKILTETLESQGSIEKLEKEAIVDALGFSQTKVKDVYTPLKKLISLDYMDSLEDILNKAKKYGFTRYPVFKNKKVVGYLNIFDLFYRQHSFWQNLIRPILRVGINQNLGDVLAVLRFKKENIALVLKGRRIYGIVTVQDLMKEVISSLIKF